jgi:hypothetical protein
MLKIVITSKPVLVIFNPDWQVKLKTNASNFALGG